MTFSGDGTKYRYTYPIYDPWCAADLHDHIFGKNVKRVGKFGKEEMKKYYLQFSG